MSEKRQVHRGVDNAHSLASQCDHVVSRPEHDMLRTKRIDENTTEGTQPTNIKIWSAAGIEGRAPGKDRHRGE